MLLKVEASGAPGPRTCTSIPSVVSVRVWWGAVGRGAVLCSGDSPSWHWGQEDEHLTGSWWQGGIWDLIFPEVSGFFWAQCGGRRWAGGGQEQQWLQVPAGRLQGPGWTDAAAGMRRGSCRPGAMGEVQEGSQRCLGCDSLLDECRHGGLSTEFWGLPTTPSTVV